MSLSDAVGMGCTLINDAFNNQNKCQFFLWNCNTHKWLVLKKKIKASPTETSDLWYKEVAHKY